MDLGEDSAIRILQTKICGVLKVDVNFATIEKREVSETISIHVDDLLISGVDVCVDYISERLNNDVDSYGVDKTHYLGMRVEKLRIQSSRA